jgi:hypothetical protein
MDNSVKKTTKAKEFLNRYRMNIVDSNRRYQSYVPSYIGGFDKYDQPYRDIPYETETLHTIQIPDSSLERLMEFYERVEESMKYTGSMDVFGHYIQRQKDEKSFREKHPAVQKAYNQYQMLYKLARSGENNGR